MNINFFNLLIITGIIHGFIFSSVILSVKKYKNRANSYLAAVVLFLSLHNVFYWIRDAELHRSIENYDFYYIPWNLLILPMYYSFVRIYFGIKDRLNPIYFAPFILCYIIHLFFLVHSVILKKRSSEINEFVNVFYDVEEYLAALFTVFVIWKTFSWIKKFESKNQKVNEPVNKTNWLKKLLYYGFFICFIWVLATIFNSTTNNKSINESLHYLVWISISILIYWLGYLGVYHGLVFAQRKNLNEHLNSERESTELRKNNKKIEYIIELIKKEKLFLDPLLSITSISNRLEINEQYFSRLFNQFHPEGFSTFINKLRVSQSKKLLLSNEFKNYTVISIGLESGFNSKSSFFRVFREETGKSPAEFRRENMS